SAAYSLYLSFHSVGNYDCEPARSTGIRRNLHGPDLFIYRLYADPAQPGCCEVAAGWRSSNADGIDARSRTGHHDDQPLDVVEGVFEWLRSNDRSGGRLKWREGFSGTDGQKRSADAHDNHRHSDGLAAGDCVSL